MKKTILIIILLSININAQTAQRIHDDAIFIDTHNDFLTKTMYYNFLLDEDLAGKTHSDLSRFKKGGLDVQFFSVWSDGAQKNPYAYANRQIDSLDAVIKRNPGKIVKVTNTEALYKAVKQNKIAA